MKLLYVTNKKCILSKMKITVSKYEKYDLAYVLAVINKCTRS